ncbi:MAG: right-handed parallel beta-helix repeat-containing protein [Candidatus Hodarchaeales archaeon]
MISYFPALTAANSGGEFSSSWKNLPPVNKISKQEVVNDIGHTPINVDGNTGFNSKALEEGWPGDGSEGDPYIISNLIFDDITKPPYPYSGIRISNCNVYFQIINCTFIGSVEGQNGIFLDKVTNGEIISNIITNMSHVGSYFEGVGIYLQNSQNISIYNNRLSNNEFYGIYITNSEDIMVIGNNITNNGDWTKEGIKLDHSPNNRINDNILINNSIGIIGDYRESYRQAEVTNNSLNGKPIIYRQDTSSGTIPKAVGQVILVNCNSLNLTNQYFDTPNSISIIFSYNLKISNNTINYPNSKNIDLMSSWNNSLFKNSFSNCYLTNSSENYISENTFLSDEISITISDQSNMNVISNNIIYSSTSGIKIDHSTQNKIINNSVTSDSGIDLYYSTGNFISENELIRGGITIEGNQNEHYIHSEIVNNTVNGKLILYWQNKNGQIVPTNTGQIILVNCNDIKIINQNLSNISRGILIAFSTNILISGNNILNENRIGIYIYASQNCNISNNMILNNKRHGILILGSENIGIHDNNISYNDLEGILIENSNEVNISQNFISNNGNLGIYFYAVRRGIIFNNSLLSNRGAGVYLDNSKSFIISWNTMFENNKNPRHRPFWDTQAVEELSSDTKENIFVFNYWSDWISPDIDNDGIIDEPYTLFLNNHDPYPLSKPIYENLPQRHLLHAPKILFPNGGETINGPVTIVWMAAVDSHMHQTTYDLLVSSEHDVNWLLLASNITFTTYVWNSSTVISGSNYVIKVIAYCNEGITSEDISDGTFRIISGYISTTVKPPYGFDIIMIVTVLTILIHQKRKRKKSGSKETNLSLI